MASVTVAVKYSEALSVVAWPVDNVAPLQAWSTSGDVSRGCQMPHSFYIVKLWVFERMLYYNSLDCIPSSLPRKFFFLYTPFYLNVRLNVRQWYTYIIKYWFHLAIFISHRKTDATIYQYCVWLVLLCDKI